MTRKLIFLLAMCVQMAFVASAGHVTQNQAKSEALAFIQQKQGTSKALKFAAAANRLQSASADNAYYYVFNVADNGGFVIVSGDDRTNPILGFSDEGNFDANKIPANMQSWLKGYEEQIKALDSMSDSEAKTLLAAPKLRATVDTRNSIAPMITTKWDQATPYWNECPEFMSVEDGDTIGELAYTGCVATAMSQIMKFYEYPAQTSQVIPAYSFTYSDGNYNYSTVQMPELPITTFDWAHMKDSYTGAEDEVYTTAVAHLMLYVGCAIKSQYGTSATGAYTDDIPKGFAQFGYGSKLAYRNDYTQDVWEGMVYDELAAGRPMIYNGTAGSGGGHSFICDGFEYGNYFHINWGWGGMGNGYFQLAVLNPHESGIGGSSSAEGYNMKQNIVYNVIPGGTAPVDDPAEPELTCTAVSGPSGWERDRVSDPFKIYKSKIVKVSYSDHSGTGKKFKTALGLLNPADGTFSVVTNSPQNGYYTVTTSALGVTTKFGDGIINSTASDVIKFGAGLTGTYHLVGIYQVEGSDEWKLMKEADRHYLEVSMTNTYCTGTQHPVINLQATNWEFTGGERVNAKEQIHVTLKNNSVDRFYGDLYLDFGGQQIDEYSQYTTVVTGEVKPGEENTITFNVTPASAGNKTVRVMLLDQYGQFNTIAQTTVNIAQSAEAEELNLSVVIAAENAVPAETEGDFDVIYDTHARFSAAITNHSNGEYNKYVLAPLFLVQKNEDGSVAGGSMVTYKQLTISLAAGETKTYYFDFDNLAYGSTYAMNIYARNNVPDSEDASHVDNIVKPGESVYYDVLPGIITWTADGTRNGVKPVEGFQVAGDVVAVSLEGLTLNSIVANQNPNTLYFIDENATAPAGIENCNIVNGSMAQNIAIKDGYPFMTPQSFVAQAISYERTFTKARREGIAENWSTIVLPFTPTTVSTNNLWIERFAQEVDGVVTFSEVNNMEANVPYIIAAKQDAIGTPITWSASNVLMKPEPIAYTSGDTYLMTGTFVGETVEEAYAVNAAGSVAKWGNAAVEPFRAYFKEITAVEGHADILLPGEEGTVDIILGDANGDGEVNVNDVTVVINYILEKNPTPFVFDNADVNGDGEVTVLDVTAIINIILNNN